MQPRAIECIHMRPSSTSKNIYEFYNITTKKVITRQYCTTMPTPANIINIIEKQAQKDKNAYGYHIQVTQSTK